MTLAARLSTKLDTLSPKLQKAGRLVMDHSEDVASRSLRHVARQKDMPAPTFSRIAEVLGYDSYDDLREVCRPQLKKQKNQFAAKARALQDSTAFEDAGSAFIVKQAQSSIANINNSPTSIDLQQLEHAAESLGSARKVILVGAMSSRPFADFLAYVASMAFENWHVLGGEPGSGTSTLHDVDQNDTALVISKAPYAARSIETAKHLRERACTSLELPTGSARHCASSAIRFFCID